jgi:glutamate N-acetyltransferase / amino-acid N-acetyltransferase
MSLLSLQASSIEASGGVHLFLRLIHFPRLLQPLHFKAMSISIIFGSVTSPQGFQGAGVFCDVKSLGTGKGSNKGRKLDMAVIYSEAPCVAAGMFTTNQICAAPVKVCVDHLKTSVARAVVVNSGNANACTGLKGRKDAETMCRQTAKHLKLKPSEVFVASTGRIGLPLPMPNVRQGIEAVCSQLATDASGGDEVAEAIMTSDTHPKQYAVEFELGGKKVRLGGIAKGAGMIHPGMSPTGKRPYSMPLHATMLSFITTDAAIAKSTLQRCLTEAVASTFNRITVDGDMSTNDTVLVLANGLAGNNTLKHTARDAESKASLALFQKALNQLCFALSKMLVKDGEGVSRFVTVRVEGAKTDKEADLAVRTVANSSLVKTSWLGGDPNWGRIIDALGYSDATVEESKVDIGYSAPGSSKVLYSLKGGKPSRVTYERLCKEVADPEFDLHIHLNLGNGKAVMYASDLTEEYVEFNKGDVTDPASLGG